MSVSPIEMLERAATALGPLNQQFVFLGGATVALHLDDPTSPGIRVTKDVDCVVEVATLMEFAQFEEVLREHGFEQRLDTDGPICRWSYDELILDIMPENAKNSWFFE